LRQTQSLSMMLDEEQSNILKTLKLYSSTERIQEASEIMGICLVFLDPKADARKPILEKSIDLLNNVLQSSTVGSKSDVKNCLPVIQKAVSSISTQLTKFYQAQCQEVTPNNIDQSILEKGIDFIGNSSFLLVTHNSRDWKSFINLFGLNSKWMTGSSLMRRVPLRFFSSLLSSNSKVRIVFFFIWLPTDFFRAHFLPSYSSKFSP
jgi:hypothetical protein